MNKNELIASAANRCGRTQTIVRECLDAILCIVSEELTKGGEVKILEFHECQVLNYGRLNE